MSILSIDILTENDSIQVYTTESMIPNEGYVLRGQLVLTLHRPVKARQITVQLKGTICNVVSNDPSIYYHSVNEPESNDASGWPITIMQVGSCAKKKDLLGRMGRFALYSTYGYATAYQKIVREEVNLLTNPTTFEQGVTCLPFELHVPAENLAPTLLLPRHSIHYALHAYVHLDSFKERYVTFRNPQQKLKPIHVSCHSFPSLHYLEFQPRVRYMGVREGHMRYEVSTVKYACLEQQTLRLSCHFFPLRPDIRLETIEVSLEQTEAYPLLTGQIRNREVISSYRMIKQTHKPSHISRSICHTDSIDDIPFEVDLTSPHITQDVNAVSLKVTHKIKVIVHFAGQTIRKMALSFPLTWKIAG
ncbi:hypothetical protein BX666DRAFT_1913957 [Dichotomocladium elegans]|nr:hypothetical protein BX666DRAFT_1913957 [Dichotomocladium elegans]